MITLCNFAQGFKRLLDLGLYFVFKDKLKLQPAEIEMLIGIINMPWVVKVVFGVISDNYTFFGSRRKSYLMMASIINVITLVLLMAFSIKFGKVFITACVFITQVCMTYCDAITDALVVQASRMDSEAGSENLNSLTQLAFALGGLLGCGFAGVIEIREVMGWDIGKPPDANLYFLIYTFFIVLLFVSVIRLDSNLEPEIIISQRMSGDRRDQNLLQNCSHTFETVLGQMKHPEIHLPLVYFLAQGILIPNFDDLHYIFLTERCGMKNFTYDFLNMLTYVGVVVLTLLYNSYLTRVETKRLVTIQLGFFLVTTILQLCNALRMNPLTYFGYEDR